MVQTYYKTLQLAKNNLSSIRSDRPTSEDIAPNHFKPLSFYIDMVNPTQSRASPSSSSSSSGAPIWQPASTRAGECLLHGTARMFAAWHCQAQQGSRLVLKFRNLTFRYLIQERKLDRQSQPWWKDKDFSSVLSWDTAWLNKDFRRFLHHFRCLIYISFLIALSSKCEEEPELGTPQ